MKVLHVFYSTLPSSKGSDIRSRDVIESQAGIGIDVLAVSSPFQDPVEMGAKVERIAGCPCYRSSDVDSRLRISEKDQGLMVKLRKMTKLLSFGDFVGILAAREGPDVIHAHSTFFCAFAGRRAAQRLGKPLVYEVRSLWEERAVMKSPTLKTRVVARLIRLIETHAMRMADHVVVISEGLYRDVVARGIPQHCITLVRNGINLSRVCGGSATINGKRAADWVFAYIGNLSDIEGLDILIEAVKILRERGWNNALQIYGDGPAMDRLKLQARNVEGVTFFGRFNPEDAREIYAEVDVVVNPRRRSSLTDKVTPLKTLEAMAWRKPIVVSSVAGMLELVRDGETGFVFEADDVLALVGTLIRILENPEVLPPVIERAWEFVSEERSWYANAKAYWELYEQLVKNRI